MGNYSLFGKIILHLQQCSKSRMTKKIFIEKILALFLLVLFAFSITPKKLLHDVFADHIDSKCKLDHSHDLNGQITTSGYNCQTDNLVIESPFENVSFTVTLFVPCFYTQQNDSSIRNLFSSDHFIFGLRGPPAC